MMLAAAVDNPRSLVRVAIRFARAALRDVGGIRRVTAHRFTHRP